MAVNRAELDMKDRLVRQVAYLTREIQALKTRQLLGGDNQVIGNSPLASSTITGLPVGDAITFNVSLSANTPTSSLFPVLHVSVYVDDDSTADNLWPLGANVTDDEQINLVLHLHHDQVLSNPDVGQHVFFVQIANFTADTQNLVLKLQAFYPEISLS